MINLIIGYFVLNVICTVIIFLVTDINSQLEIEGFTVADFLVLILFLLVGLPVALIGAASVLIVIIEYFVKTAREKHPLVEAVMGFHIVKPYKKQGD